MTMGYIRKRYGVPAKRGARVRFLGQAGTIVSSAGAYLRVRIDGSKCVLTCHPNMGVEYLSRPALKANACQCDPNPSIGGSPPCPVHDGESEDDSHV